MPYIREYRKERLHATFDEGPANPGELNYVITMYALRYLRDHGTSYRILNEIIGAMAAAQAEFYRRAVVPFEEESIARNGDVYVDSQFGAQYNGRVDEETK